MPSSAHLPWSLALTHTAAKRRTMLFLLLDYVNPKNSVILRKSPLHILIHSMSSVEAKSLPTKVIVNHDTYPLKQQMLIITG